MRALMHYSHEPLGPLRDSTQKSRLDRKPNGLWVSVEDGEGWRDWCEDNDFRTGWSHIYEIELAPAANLLLLESALDIDRFHHDYAMDDEYGSVLIDWQRVAKTFDGIIIAPYQWSHRLVSPASDWYYGWDCSSGCLWQKSAIATVVEAKAVA